MPERTLPPYPEPVVRVAKIFAFCLVMALVYYAGFRSDASESAKNVSLPNNDIVELSDSQLQAIKIETAAPHQFAIESDAVGSIDFNEDNAVQVFSPYTGKIIDAIANLGDEVKKGQPLFTIDSPDLMQAEATLIASAASFTQTSHALARAKEMQKINGMAQKDLEQAITDEATAESAFNAARDTVRLFGKKKEEIDRIIATRRIDPALVITSPISGRVTARNAAPGLLIQPGTTPAPYAVADISSLWMVANLPESETPSLHVGQPVKVTLMAYPGRLFTGNIATVGAAIDPATHTIQLRSSIRDPKHELRPGMMASFAIQTSNPVTSMAVPENALVRKSDGSMTIWITKDNHHFDERIVKIGLRQDGLVQVMDGLQPGERVATDGAVFISNMRYAMPAE